MYCEFQCLDLWMLTFADIIKSLGAGGNVVWDNAAGPIGLEARVQCSWNALECYSGKYFRARTAFSSA